MMRSKSALIAAICLSMSIASMAAGCRALGDTAPVAVNVFPNGDMSAGADVPDGWSIAWTGSGKVAISRDTQVYKSTPASLCLQSVGGAALGGAGHALNGAWTSFTLSGSLKCAGQIKDVNVAVQSFAPGWKQSGWANIADIKQPSDWTDFSAKVQIPAGTMASQLVVMLNGDGQAWLDDVKLVADAPVATAPPLPSKDAPALPTVVLASDPLVHYVGRFEATPSGPKAAWPASTEEIVFNGSAVNARLNESGGSNEYEVFVDDVPVAVLKPSSGDHLYRVFTARESDTHTLRIIKRTESFFGSCTFEGFQLSAKGKVTKIAPRQHKIEVIGDSISCGYGNEGLSQQEHFSALTENAAYAYGAVASRELNADYVCVAWSGKKMWPNNTIPELYDRAIPTDEQSTWDFGKWTPDVVVINLATNDFAKEAPDKAGWTAAYEAFIKHVRTNYPNAPVYCAMSPMMYGKPLDTLSDYLAQIVADLTAAGVKDVRVMPFKTQDGNNGFGADWHPNLKNDKLIAQTMTQVLATDLGWKPVANRPDDLPTAALLSLPRISLTGNNGND